MNAFFAAHPFIRRTLFVLLGALGGFAYYSVIGCTTGACPITSNPYISTGYGALIGIVLASGRSTRNRVPGQKPLPESRPTEGGS